MKKFEFLTISSYIKDGNWIIVYEGYAFNKYKYQDALLCELGNQGWELITVSTSTATDVGSGINLDGYGGSTGSDVFTNEEMFYFKREVNDNSKTFKLFEKKIKHIRRVTNEKEELIELEKNLFREFDELVNALLSEKGYRKDEGISPEVFNSWYKEKNTEKVNKKMFGEDQIIKQEMSCRVDVYLDDKLIIKSYQKEKSNTEWEQIYLPYDNFDFTKNNLDKVKEFINEKVDSEKIFL